MNDSKVFWSAQTSSLNQSSDLEFYRRKANEHAALMTPEERDAGCIDLGCGAGEMLMFLTDHLRVKVGLDFSESMLAAAREALAGRDIELTSADAFAYLPMARIAVWTTTGAMNQYLPAQDLQRLVGIFASNPAAQSFFLFDCIDPLRYHLMPLGISYRPAYAERRQSPNLRQRAAQLYFRARYSACLSLGVLDKDVLSLANSAMGYAVAPHFWHRIGSAFGLDVQMVSSRYYEYRYHAILRKK